LAFFVVSIALFLLALWWARFDLTRMERAGTTLADFAARSWPPNFVRFPTLVGALFETLAMAYAGTFLGALLALPIAMIATRGVLPRPLLASVRVLLNAWRTIPALVWALVFVNAVGLGPMPGVLALAMYSTGYLARYYYEAFELVDPGLKKALASLGASNVQIMLHGVLPPSRPLLLSHTIAVFEYNVRAASILGVVGAGGIGYYLFNYLQNLQYKDALACLLLLLVAVLAFDAISTALRRRLVD